MAAEQTAKNEYNEQYRKENTKRISVRFFPTDVALYEHVKGQADGIAPYIKRLIREDMERNGLEFTPNPRRSRYDSKDGGSEC